MMKQHQQPNELGQLIPLIIQCHKDQDYERLKQLHIQAFNYVSLSNPQLSEQNQHFLLTNNYLQHSITNLNIPQVQCEIIRTLANTCNHPEFQKQPAEFIVQSLEVSYRLIHSLPNFKDISDILVYLGNVASKSVQISQLLLTVLGRLLELSTHTDANLYRNICFCMHNITQMLDEQGLSVKDRLICLQILENGVKREDCDLLHNEILHPLSVLYTQSEEIDNFLLNSNIVKFVISSKNGEFLRVTLSVLKQFSLTESIALSNFLIDSNILDIALEFSNNRNKQIRKFVYLIVINLSYNDSKITNRIISHNIINRIINGLITHILQEKQYCMQVILNLQKTGDDNVYKKLIELGTLQIINNLLDDVDLVIQRIFLDSLCRFYHFAKEQQDLKTQEEIKAMQPKIDELYQDSKDPSFLELYHTFMKLI